MVGPTESGTCEWNKPSIGSTAHRVKSLLNLATANGPALGGASLGTGHSVSISVSAAIQHNVNAGKSTQAVSRTAQGPLPRPVRRYPSIQTSQPLAESSPNSHKRNQLLGPLWPSLQTPDPVRAIPSKTPSYPYPRSFDVENQVMESLVSYTVTTGATTGASPWYTRYLAAHRLTYRVFSSARIASFSSSRGASSRLSTRSNYSTEQGNDNDSVSKWISVNTFAENAHLVNE